MQIINKDLWEQRGICETERVTCWIFNTKSESQFTISLSQAGTSSVKNSTATASFGGCVWDTGNIEKKIIFFFHLSWQMWKINVMFLKVGDVACSSFHFRYNEQSRGFFQDVMLALRYSREQENSFCYSLSHVLKKKKKKPLQPAVEKVWCIATLLLL